MLLIRDARADALDERVRVPHPFRVFTRSVVVREASLDRERATQHRQALWKDPVELERLTGVTSEPLHGRKCSG